MTSARSERYETLAALALCATFALVTARGVSMERAWGWDESMHAGWPAARIALALGERDASEAARAMLECQRYPFVWPLVLGLVQWIGGLSELACRTSGRAVWGIGLFGLFLLARELARGIERERAPVRNARLVPWLALIAGAACPLALSYAGTLFLEVPFTVLAIFALRAWLRRRAPGAGARCELAAGAWLALAFFCKFNYGLLLLAGLGADLALEGLRAARAGQGRAFARRALLLGLPLCASGLWWFVLPFPFVREFGASHRHALVDFLGGNRDPSLATPWAVRGMHWGAYFVRSPRVLLVLALGVALALARLRSSAVRSLALALAATALPIAWHPFHLDRFLLPGGPALWCLAALGLAALLPARPRARAALLAGALPLLAWAPERDGRWWLERLGLANEESRAYQERVLAEWRSLAPDRVLETNGLSRSESEALLDLLAGELAPSDRVAWVGLSPVFSPAAMMLGLARRDRGFLRAVREDRLDAAFVTIESADPGWSDGELLAWAGRFDVWLGTRPIDVRLRPGREFLGDYQKRLIERGGWVVRELGTLQVARPGGEAHTVWVYAARRAR